MSILHAFRALRPSPDRVAEVACVPYDVINTEEARRMADGKPLSFLHVIRPEIDLPEGTDEHAPEVYEMGARNLRRFRESSEFLEEDRASLYIYRLIMGGKAQTGIFGCVSVREYDGEIILKHERTRPAKEEDRTRHIFAQKAHAEPVMLTFRVTTEISEMLREATEETPIYDFVAGDGIRHTVWRVADPDRLASQFVDVQKLYVADGHHRCKAASRAAETLRKEKAAEPDAEFEFFPAVLFPMEEMRILAYNRVVRQLPVTPAAFLDTLANKYDLDLDSGLKVPEERGTVCLYIDGRWHTMRLPETAGETIAADLDAARIGEHVLSREIGITDQTRDPNIDFIGGIRGTAELERLVDAGRAELAISMYATSIEELMAVSDAGLLMPPKSTWFEPKLRSGLLVHMFDTP